jgi:3-phosphoshikimate 1-carboxyvinyltransferase
MGASALGHQIGVNGESVIGYFYNPMHAIIHPGSISGTITAPPSKSIMQRVCAAMWVMGGNIVIKNPGSSADDNVLIALLRQAGCKIAMAPNGAMVIEAIPARMHTLEVAHFGESGLAARMCTPVLALAGREVQLTGDESLLGRPMDFLKEVLPALGVSVHMDGAGLPATINGRLMPGNIEVDGSVSSQFITGLLMAYAGAAASDVTIRVRNPVSKPYIDLTLQVMKDMGLPVPTNNDYSSFYFSPNAVQATKPA